MLICTGRIVWSLYLSCKYCHLNCHSNVFASRLNVGQSVSGAFSWWGEISVRGSMSNAGQVIKTFVQEGSRVVTLSRPTLTSSCHRVAAFKERTAWCIFSFYRMFSQDVTQAGRVQTCKPGYHLERGKRFDLTGLFHGYNNAKHSAFFLTLFIMCGVLLATSLKDSQQNHQKHYFLLFE